MMTIAGFPKTLFVLIILLSDVPILAQESQTIDDERIASINAKVAAIKDFEKQNPSKIKAFEAKEGDQGAKLIELQKMPESVPEGSLFMVYVLYGKEGRVLMYEVVPTANDWSGSFTHYFDEQERTIMFELYSGSFNSRCTDILRIRKKYYFDDNFDLIKNIVSYADKDEKPIKNVEHCDNNLIERDRPRIYRTYKEAATQTKKNSMPYLEERPKKRAKMNSASDAPDTGYQFYAKQRLQWGKANEILAQKDKEIERINQRNAKIRFALYVIAAVSLSIGIMLMIRRKIGNRNVDKN